MIWKRDHPIQAVIACFLMNEVAGGFKRTRPGNISAYDYCQADLPDQKPYKPLENGELLSVHQMNRHGDRTPLVYLPFGMETEPWNCNQELSQVLTKGQNMPLKPRVTKYDQGGCGSGSYCSVNLLHEYMWPGTCSTGQLTPKGTKQLYKLGQSLNKIYVKKLKFISSQLNEDDVHVMATDVWRCLQSGIALVSGLFPHAKKPVTIYTQPVEVGTIVPNPTACPKVAKLETENQSSLAYKKHIANIQELNNEFNKVLGKPGVGWKPKSIEYYVDTFQPRECNKFPPTCNSTTKECVSKPLIKKAMDLGNYELQLRYRDIKENHPLLSKLRIGGFLIELKRNLLLMIQQHSQKKLVTLDWEYKLKKFIIYSAHDSSIASVLGALLAEDMRFPPYASSVVFELWATKNPVLCQTSKSKDYSQFKNYQLRMIYNGVPLITPWCTTGTCNISKLMEYLDSKLELAGGFEHYGKYLSANPPPTWNGFEECWS